MDKNKLMGYVNSQFRGGLNTSNTSYASINKSKDVWWFNVPIPKFAHDVHLLLNANDHAIWIKLPKGFVEHVPFRIREDKNAFDLEISADKTKMYLKDLKSGGTYFNFKPFVKEIINF